MRLLMGEDWAGPYAFDQRTRPPFVAMEKKSSILSFCMYGVNGSMDVSPMCRVELFFFLCCVEGEKERGG